MKRAASPVMLGLVLGLPDQLERGAETARRPALGRPGRFDCVVVAGMGGSGISGRLMQGLLYDRVPTPVLVANDYAIPAAAGRHSLFVAVSHSGNTEETLSAYDEARGRGCRVVAVTHGGELARRARGHGHPVVEVPGGMPPRAALGYLFSALAVTLERLGVAPDGTRDRAEAVRLMRARSAGWQRRARLLAREVGDALPVVYSTARPLDAVAERWRCQLNENSGVMCHTSALPEHNHNEIVGMGGPGFIARRNVVLALLDRETHPRTRLRLEAVLDIAANGFRSARAVESEGRSRLARVFSLVMLGDLVSVELARLRGKDPMDIGRIDELKRRMSGAKRGN